MIAHCEDENAKNSPAVVRKKKRGDKQMRISKLDKQKIMLDENVDKNEADEDLAGFSNFFRKCLFTKNTTICVMQML